MKLLRIALVVALVTLMTGCASTLSGVGGNEAYACKAPEGVLCTSIAGVYANSVQNNLPSQRVEKHSTDSGPQPTAIKRTAAIAGSAVESNPIRSPARILRVWIAPWEDADGDLQDQSYVYVVVDSGRWLIEHQRAAVRNAFMPITAPNPAAPPPSDAKSVSESKPSSPPPSIGPFSPAISTPLPSEGKKDVE